MAFQWQCPYCGHWATITDSNTKTDIEVFHEPNRYGKLGTVVRTCVTPPNPQCGEIELTARVATVKLSPREWVETGVLYQAHFDSALSRKGYAKFRSGPHWVRLQRGLRDRNAQPQSVGHARSPLPAAGST